MSWASDNIDWILSTSITYPSSASSFLVALASSLSAASSLTFPSDFVHSFSTGGGASLNYIAGRTLPGIASLEASAKQFAVEIIKPVDNQ